MDEDDNSEWRAYLEWKQEGGVNIDHLYKVQLVSEYFEDTMIEGGSYTIVENPGIWRFTFTGLDLTDSDYANVDFTLQNRMNFWLQEEDSNPTPANKRVFGDGTLTTNVAVKMSSTEKVFEVADKDGISLK